MDTLYSIEKLTEDKIHTLRNEGLAQQEHQLRRDKDVDAGGVIGRFLAWISNRGSDQRETRLVIR